MIMKWMGQPFTLDLLYSSEIHGKTCPDFHTKCDGKKFFLVLYKTSTKKRFGAFNQQTISSVNEFKGGNGKDFIFTLDKKRMFLNDKNTIYSLYNHKNCFPTFGYPSDFYVTAQAFNDFSSYFSFPSSFGTKQKDEEGLSDTYFTGSKYFKLDVVEVFQLNFDMSGI